MSYAFVDLSTNTAREVLPGQGFTDPAGFQHAPNWAELYSPQKRTGIGLRQIGEPGPPPYGKRIASLVLQVIDSQPVRVAVLEDIPVVELQAAKVAQVDAERDRRQQLDFAYDFGATVAIDDFGTEIAAGVRSLQMRTEPDQRNWMALQGQATAAVLQGSPETVMPMRAEDNWNVQTTAAQVLQATAAMVARNAQLLFFGAALKSQIRAAETAAAIAAIDITAGWAA